MDSGHTKPYSNQAQYLAQYTYVFTLWFWRGNICGGTKLSVVRTGCSYYFFYCIIWRCTLLNLDILNCYQHCLTAWKWRNIFWLKITVTWLYFASGFLCTQCKFKSVCKYTLNFPIYSLLKKKLPLTILIWTFYP